MNVAEKTAFARDILKDCEVIEQNPLKITLKTLNDANEEATIRRIRELTQKCDAFNIVSVVRGNRGHIKLCFKSKHDSREFLKFGTIDDNDLKRLIQSENSVLVN